MDKTDKLTQSPSPQKGKKGQRDGVVLGSFMNNKKKVEKIDLKILNSIKDEENSCIELMKSVQHLSLHPFHLYNISNSIRQILDDLVYRYSKSIGGILLNYQKLKIETPAGAISGDNCYIHINVQGEFFKFLPDVGRTCFGYVTHMDATNISCIVHQIFHVSMTKPADEGDEWLGYQVQIGQKVLFRIMYVNLMSYMPHITAELVKIEEEICYDIEGAGMDTTLNTKKSNKIIFDIDDDDDEEEPREAEDEELNNSKHKKTKKKRTENLDTLVDYIEEDLNCSTEKNKKKKKKIKEEDISLPLESEDEYNITMANDNEMEATLNGSSKKKSKKHRISEIEETDVQNYGKKHKKIKLETD